MVEEYSDSIQQRDEKDSLLEVGLPQYYRASFFSEDSCHTTEAGGGRQGVAGDPVPYTIVGDHLMTAMLLGCFILSVMVMARQRDFIARQMRNFFRIRHGNMTEINETTGEMWAQLLLIVQTCLLFSISYFLYACTNARDAFLADQYTITGLFMGIFLGYFLLKWLLYEGVGWVFFDVKKNEQWAQLYIFFVAMEGLLMFPLVLLLSYFDLSMENALIYVAVVVILVKIWSFYRSFVIFFNEKGAYFKIILYLCALEIVPLCVLWGILDMTSQYLKVNF